MKSKITTYAFFVFSIIAIFFLSRFLLPPGSYIVGHDSGLALNSKDFLQSRLYAWSIQGFGQDNSPHFGSIMIHFVDFFTSKLSGVSFAGNYLNLFFWLSMIFASAYVFSNSIKKSLGKYFPVFSSTFITINFFIIQSLFILERAKYSILVANLLLLTVLFKLNDKLIGYKKAFLYITLILFIFNCGSWLGIPLYGSMFVLVSVFSIFKIVTYLVGKNFSDLWRFVVFLLSLLVGFILINAYSIFPYFSTFLRGDASQLVNPVVIEQNKEWLRALSQAGSYINFFRLQGIPDWYSGSSGINMQHAYAYSYLTNPLLIVSSFIFPFLALGALILKKNESKKYILFFTAVTLFGMFFMAGSHGPLGFLYEFLYTYIPGFAVFRSPYYKFASAFLIGYIGLISFTLSSFVEKIGSKFKIVVILVILGSWLAYHGVIFDADKIFSWQKDLSTKVSIPPSVLEFSKSINDQDFGDSRILLVPPANQNWKNDAYNWGYWSLTNLPSVVAPYKSFLVNDGLLSKEQNVLVNDIYLSIKDNREVDFLGKANRLGIKHVLLRKDILNTSDWSSGDDLHDYEENLSDFKSLRVKETFSDWILYEIVDLFPSKIILTNDIVSLSSNDYSLVNQYTDIDQHLGKDVVGTPGNDFSIVGCQSCELEMQSPNHALPEVTLLPSSKLYFFKEIKEKKVLVASSGSSKAFDYLGFALRRTSEVMAMLRTSTEDIQIATALKVVNHYLNIVYEYVKNIPNYDKDFSTYIRVKDSILPIEVNLQNQVANKDFLMKSEMLRNEVNNVLWTIRQITNLYSPMINILDEYRHRKIYNLTIKLKGNYKIHVNADTMPFDISGNRIFPEHVEIYINGKYVSLKPQKENEGVFFDLGLMDPGSYESILVFGDLPNLYEDIGFSVQSLPINDNGCVAGRVQHFNNNSAYRVNFSITDNTQRLRFYVRNKSIQQSINDGFFKWDIENEVDSVGIAGEYSYLYKPYGATDPYVYVCSSNNSIPQVSNWEIYEIFSPRIIVEKMTEDTIDISNNPISYNQISPVKYELNINMQDPRILVFNETFNPLWSLRQDGLVVETATHFMIDGHANAWILPEDANGKFTIEYLPQEAFKVGKIITSIFLSTMILVYVWKFIYPK